MSLMRFTLRPLRRPQRRAFSSRWWSHIPLVCLAAGTGRLVLDVLLAVVLPEALR